MQERERIHPARRERVGAAMRSAHEGSQGNDAGRRPLHILIVEDEIMLAMLLEEVVAQAGHTSRKAARLDKALALLEAERFDAAVLDVNLNGERTFPLAAKLRERGVRFLFASGYGDAGVPPEYRDCRVLQKPYTQEAFSSALQALLQGVPVDATEP